MIEVNVAIESIDKEKLKSHINGGFIGGLIKTAVNLPFDKLLIKTGVGIIAKEYGINITKIDVR